MPKAWLLSLVLLPSLAQGREEYNVRMPDTVKVDDKELKLNGMGLRKRLVFKVYVAGLYLETPSKSGPEIISSDQAKRITLFMLRDLGKDKIIDALRDGFEKNAKAQMPALKERLERLMAQLPDQAKKGSTIVITYLPGTGTVLTRAGDRTVIEGKDFAEALFSVWLGREPVDEELKKGLVGA
jgi:hypothetical protein